MIFRRYIFMGQSGNDTVYFDTKENTPLKAPKHKFLDVEKAAYQSIFIVPGMFILMFLNRYFLNDLSTDILFSYGSIAILIFSSVLFAVFLTILIERVLYKNVKVSKPATNDELKRAIYGNGFWVLHHKQRVGFKLKFLMIMVDIIVAFAFLGYIRWIYRLLNQEDLFYCNMMFEDIMMFFLCGMMGFALVLLLWINNLVRWLNVVEKYQKRKVKYRVRKSDD